jgi:predicted DCC family thiol-disulfide oxidoreductase YuxK
MGGDAGPLRVLYDGECGLCRAQALWLRRLDWRCRLRWEDFHASAAQGTCPAGLAREALEQSLHVVAADGRVLRGFLALRRLARCLPALWPFVPLLYLPGAASLGEPLYRLVARNRHRLDRDRGWGARRET